MNLRHQLLAASAALTLSLGATAALAAGNVSTTAAASVTVLSPVTINKTQDLLFGNVIRPGTGTNTVTIDTSDTVALTGAGDGSLAGGTLSSAKFTVAGPAGQVYTTGQTLTFNQAGLTSIAPSLPTATTGSVGTIPGVSGPSTQELRYGGSFTMSNATTAQAYTGTLTVTINYN